MEKSWKVLKVQEKNGFDKRVLDHEELHLRTELSDIELPAGIKECDLKSPTPDMVEVPKGSIEVTFRYVCLNDAIVNALNELKLEPSDILSVDKYGGVGTIIYYG